MCVSVYVYASRFIGNTHPISFHWPLLIAFSCMHSYGKYCLMSVVVNCICILAISKEYIISYVDQIVLWTERSFTGENEMRVEESRNHLEK